VFKVHCPSHKQANTPTPHNTFPTHDAQHKRRKQPDRPGHVTGCQARAIVGGVRKNRELAHRFVGGGRRGKALARGQCQLKFGSSRLIRISCRCDVKINAPPPKHEKNYYRQHGEHPVLPFPLLPFLSGSLPINQLPRGPTLLQKARLPGSSLFPPKVGREEGKSLIFSVRAPADTHGRSKF